MCLPHCAVSSVSSMAIMIQNISTLISVQNVLMRVLITTLTTAKILLSVSIAKQNILLPPKITLSDRKKNRPKQQNIHIYQFSGSKTNSQSATKSYAIVASPSPRKQSFYTIIFYKTY